MTTGQILLNHTSLPPAVLDIIREYTRFLWREESLDEAHFKLLDLTIRTTRFAKYEINIWELSQPHCGFDQSLYGFMSVTFFVMFCCFRKERDWRIRTTRDIKECLWINLSLADFKTDYSSGKLVVENVVVSTTGGSDFEIIRQQGLNYLVRVQQSALTLWDTVPTSIVRKRRRTELERLSS